MKTLSCSREDLLFCIDYDLYVMLLPYFLNRYDYYGLRNNIDEFYINRYKQKITTICGSSHFNDSEFSSIRVYIYNSKCSSVSHWWDTGNVQVINY